MAQDGIHRRRLRRNLLSVDLYATLACLELTCSAADRQDWSRMRKRWIWTLEGKEIDGSEVKFRFVFGSKKSSGKSKARNLSYT